MIIRLKIGRWRFSYSMAPVTNIIGVNSTLPSGNHILMWDFDNISLRQAVTELRRIQKKYTLPTIYLLTTGKPNSFIAYCFKENNWHRAVEIVAATKHVDPNFFKYAVYRGHFTLRVSMKCGRKPKIIQYLTGKRKQNCSVKDLISWTLYETIEDNYPTKLMELKIPNE